MKSTEQSTEQSTEFVAILGEGALDGIKSYPSVDKLPEGVRVVVVPWGDRDPGHLLAEVAERHSEVRVLCWLEGGQGELVEEALKAGFDDVTVGEGHTLHRLKSLKSELEILDGYTARVFVHTGLVKFITEIIHRPALQDVLRTAILGMRDLFKIDRVTVAFVRPGEEFGYVVMERNRKLDNVVIRVDDYPELIEVMRTCEPIVISDVFGDELMAGVRGKLEAADVVHKSAVLFPLMHNREVVGALFLRSETPIISVEDTRLGMGSLISLVTSVAIGHGLRHDDLLSEQRQLLENKEFTDRKLEDLKKYEHLFERSMDGIVVTDPEGHIRYSNDAAVGLLGREHGTLQGILFSELFEEQSQEAASRAFLGYDVGGPRGYVDLWVALRSDQTRVISAAIRHLETPDGVLVTFRDVSAQRALESELKQTKEFLENLIQSSVDAIVASDMSGGILLFNRSAERILGYTAEEAVGDLDVRSIYEPEGAVEIMTMLRSGSYGGRGRLEIMRRNLLGKDGEVLPVNLTAAIIYEGEEEIATVGVFTDLRDRIHMEKKLEKAQEAVRDGERRVIAVELAGAAAHELNQPLTSVMGYAELLKKKIGDDSEYSKGIGVICRETTRMAKIVKRLGKITSYSRRPYVGGASILRLAEMDLDDTNS